MVKLVSLVAVLSLSFACCCQLGGMVRLVRPGAGVPSARTTPGVNPTVRGRPAPDQTPEQSASGAEESTVRIDAGDELADMPLYPGAKVEARDVNLPAALAPFAMQDQAGSQGVDFRMYSTTANSNVVSTFYKGRMPQLGWTPQPTGVQGGALVLQMYTRDAGQVSAAVYVTQDPSTKRTQIVLARMTNTQ